MEVLMVETDIVISITITTHVISITITTYVTHAVLCIF
jgi:hypothetical protein